MSEYDDDGNPTFVFSGDQAAEQDDDGGGWADRSARAPRELVSARDPEWAPHEQSSPAAGGGTSAKPLAHALEALLAPQSDNEIWLIERVEDLQEQQKGTNQLLRDVLVRLKTAERSSQTKEQEWTSRWAELDQEMKQEILARKEVEARNRVLAEESGRAKRAAQEAQAIAAAERSEARIENLAHKAVSRMESRSTAATFLPWLEAARAKQAADRVDEVNQMRAEMFDRLAELGASLQADLADALERSDEKQQTGLSETARILDQKLEQTNAVVHEQLEQLDRVMSSAHEEIKQKVEQIDSDHQATVKVLEEHREVHTKFQEEHDKATDTHRQFEQQHGDAAAKLQTMEEFVAGLQIQLQESQTLQESTSNELTKIQTDVSGLATLSEEHGTNHTELMSKLAADVSRIEATLDAKAPTSEFDRWAEEVAKSEEASFERLQAWLMEVVPPEDFSRLQRDVVLLHGEVALVVGAADNIKQTKIELDGLAAGVQENVCSLTDQVDQMEVAMEEHIAQARDVMAGLEDNVEGDKARDDRLDAVQDLMTSAENAGDDVKNTLAGMCQPGSAN